MLRRPVPRIVAGAVLVISLVLLALLVSRATGTDRGAQPATRAGSGTPAPSTPVASAAASPLTPTPDAVSTVAPATGPDPSAPLRGVPAAGTSYFGVQLDWTVDTPRSYTRRSGVRPAVYGEFVRFPLSAATIQDLTLHASQARTAGAALFVTLEPFDGLGTTTVATSQAAARVFARINATGVRVYVRFAHEMNGSWYPWGQQPQAYVAAFRTFATAVHRLARDTQMVWSPNYGGGYPFPDQQYNAVPGSSEFTALDTNGDGRLTMDDDMYGPYYPGDAAVDWVGLTLYYFGRQYPWGENERPDDGRFAAQVSGTYASPSGDESGVPDFYASYAQGHRKPMALSETGAFFRPGNTGQASELDVKRAWLGQVLGPQVRARFPRLGMINWFEFEKQEQDIAGETDWRVSHDPPVLAALKKALTATPGRFRFGSIR